METTYESTKKLGEETLNSGLNLEKIATRWSIANLTMACIDLFIAMVISILWIKLIFVAMAGYFLYRTMNIYMDKVYAKTHSEVIKLLLELLDMKKEIDDQESQGGKKNAKNNRKNRQKGHKDRKKS